MKKEKIKLGTIVRILKTDMEHCWGLFRATTKTEPYFQFDMENTTKERMEKEIEKKGFDIDNWEIERIC